ncbi:dehydrogenase [Roseibium aquae]|uniref:Dehydrogenase n=1 Tax=Roseibium aquae TaxID=1323746 RepID=A0A916T8F3_9HYPH|nr:SDR family NAD(P)-dependent oxidoreductase [Roseibium aquae]GGB35666.1 dehydrogenase [Roseibium aquae]
MRKGHVMTICKRKRKAPTSALITGASRGIGEAFARALPRETHLVLTGRDAASLANVQIELEAQGRSVSLVEADLTEADGRAAVIDAAEAASVDLVIANAGMGSYGSFLERSVEDHLKTVELNLSAVIALTHALLPGMTDRARTSKRPAGLILMGSSAAFVPVPKLAVYAATKAFMLSFSEALAAELGPEPVDVLCVCPGATRTGFGRTAGFSGGDLPGAMDPAEVARKALDALGKRRTLIVEKGPGRVLQPAADLRAAFAGGLKRGLDLSASLQRRNG